LASLVRMIPFVRFVQQLRLVATRIDSKTPHNKVRPPYIQRTTEIRNKFPLGLAPLFAHDPRQFPRSAQPGGCFRCRDCTCVFFFPTRSTFYAPETEYFTRLPLGLGEIRRFSFDLTRDRNSGAEQ